MRILCLDIGEKRVGVAFADTAVKIAVPREMIPVDGNEMTLIAKACRLERAEILVSGFPRNNKGEETKQTEFVKDFVERMKEYFEEIGQKLPKIVFQDESLTSVQAESRLSRKKELTRRDRANGLVDSEAAAIILQDFLENLDRYIEDNK